MVPENVVPTVKTWRRSCDGVGVLCWRYCIQSPDLNLTEIVWDGLDWRVKEKQPTSYSFRSSIKIVRKPFQVTTS